jgi:glycosyltransferase involved in cell wall biosynthesis
MTSPSKIKVLFHSNYSKVGTGFGKNMRNVLLSLYNDPNIEIFEAANGLSCSERPTTPWKCYGTYPIDPSILRLAKRDHNVARKASYGYYCIDGIVKKVKPDIYIGIEDVWAFNDFETKEWWSKTKKIIWSTLDSLPILDRSIELDSLCEKFLVWSSFAEREMKNAGCKNVETLHGFIDYKNFSKLKNRDELRKKHNLQEDFVIGFVFKNQLRKSVPNLLEGFKLFKKKNPNTKCKLLLHTDWANERGWNITKYIKEKKINPYDILATYVCGECKNYSISKYRGENIDCDTCGSKKSVTTKNFKNSVSEKELNEIYNLMDVYCHPFTSGGQELPIQEAKSAGLLTLVTKYSCGEDSAYEHQGGIPLDWNEYREPSTNFVKASTCPKSICNNLERVLLIEEKEKKNLLKNSKRNILENFSIEKNSIRLKKIIKNVYENDLKNKLDNKNKKTNKSDFKIKSFLDGEKPENRLLIVIPESAGDVLMINSLLKNIKTMYPKKNIYVATKKEFFPMIEDNTYLHKVVPYSPELESSGKMEGVYKDKGLFSICFLPHIKTQRFGNYTHNGLDKIQFFQK